MLYVTHALDEAVQLADSMVLLKAGRVIASGSLPEVAARADLPLAQRDDAGALLICRVAAHEAARELTVVEGAGVSFRLPLLDLPVGAECRLRIPAREVILAGKMPESISVRNIIAGTVRRIAPQAASRSVLVEVGLPSGGLLARVTQDAIVHLRLEPGGPVLALVKSTAIEVLAASAPSGGALKTGRGVSENLTHRAVHTNVVD